MAIIKGITTSNGTNMNYHRINNLFLHKDSTVEVSVYSYADKEHRAFEDEDKQLRQPVHGDQILRDKIYFFETVDGIVSFPIAYGLLKSLDEFDDAEDDI